MKKILFLFLTAALFLSACTGAKSDYTAFAQCLSEEGATMYGAFWCPHCADQKEAFGGGAFEAINYVECDPKGPNGQPELCLEKDIKGYPTWILADGERFSGFTELEVLAEATSCELPSETP